MSETDFEEDPPNFDSENTVGTALVKAIFAHNYFTRDHKRRSTGLLKNQNPAKRCKSMPQVPASRCSSRKDCTIIKGQRYERGTYFKLRSGHIVRSIFFGTNGCGEEVAHVVNMARPEDTFVGKLFTRQIFATLTCRTVSLSDLVRPVTVHFKQLGLTRWKKSGGLMPTESENYWFNLQYDDDGESSFEIVHKVFHQILKTPDGECGICNHLVTKSRDETGYFKSGSFWKRGVQFSKGDAILLAPNTFEVERQLCDLFKKYQPPRNFDADIYTEAYRFAENEFFKGDNSSIPEPLQVAIIKGFVGNVIVARPLIRIWNNPSASLTLNSIVKCDLKEVFWTDIEVKVDPISVQGKCIVEAKFKASSFSNAWERTASEKFFFERKYCPRQKIFVELPSEALTYQAPADLTRKTLETNLPLNTMDIFSGCGGLSKGLEMSGCASIRWAIEKDKMAAAAFKSNHPNATVFNEDAILLLKELIGSQKRSDFPDINDVDIICSGPPCLGFTGLNRFKNTSKYRDQRSLFQVTLSFIDMVRPRFFLIENVATLTTFAGQYYLNKICGVLLELNYQFRIGILQCGNYGVPQDRKRTFIIGASMAEKLPFFPNPTHVFKSRAVSSRFRLTTRDKRESAPFRNIMAQEVFSDLRKIRSGGDGKSMPYLRDPIGNFQREMRLSSDGKTFRDEVVGHFTNEISILMKARISLIPERPGADWRDLPNTIWEFPDGTTTEMLNYRMVDGFTEAPELEYKGVCPCMIGPKMRCDKKKYKKHTIIPWAMVHNARSNGFWKGCYGRVHNDSYFSTITCDIGPELVQGRVLHPDPKQKRLISVRETSRAMGMTDSFSLAGDIKEMSKQVGNAVPPPVALALGRELLISVSSGQF